MPSTNLMLLAEFVLALPLIAVSVAGIYLARARLRKSAPRASRNATWGFTLLALYALVGPVVRIVTSFYSFDAQNAVAYASVLTIANVAGFVALLGAAVLLLLGILADRGSDDLHRDKR
jgi:hypothetical protein